MGIYYRYVNFTRGEFVDLSDLRDGGDKENAVLYCAPAIAWMLVHPAHGDPYRGRWRSYTLSAPAHDVRVASDAEYDFYEMAEGGTTTFPEGFLNITPGLLNSLRLARPAFVEDYHPRIHDIDLLTHRRTNGIYKLLEAVSASCKCGWTVGPIYGDHRDETLLRVVSDHVNSKRTESRPREPRPFVYRSDLSSDDMCDLIEALDKITSDKGSEHATDNTQRLIALRDRLMNVSGTR